MVSPRALSRRQLMGLGGGAAAAALGLSACGSNTGRAPESSSSAGGKPSLSQWYHEYGEDGVQDAVTRYAASYTAADITVNWKPGTYEQLVSAALLTDRVPDVFEYGNGPTIDMITSGQVLDVTETLGDDKAKFTPSLIDPMIFQDKVWAIPQTADMQMLYYRKDLLEAKNITPPTTFAELVDAANELTTDTIGGFFAGNDGGVGVLANLFIWASGGEFLNDAKTGIGFADEAMYDGLAAYTAFSKSKGLLQSSVADWYSPDPFTKRKAAMVWTGLWNLPLIEAAMPGEYGVIPFPKLGDSGQQVVPTGAFSACVSAKGVDPAAAKEFIKWLWVDQTDDQIDFSLSYGFHIPTQTAVAEGADQLKSGAAADAVSFVSKYGHAPTVLWTPTISTAYGSAITNVVKKGADPKSEIAKVASKAKSEMRRING